MAVIKARSGERHLQACVRCGTPSDGPYCDEHRPAHYDPAKPFWGGQGSTSAQAAQRQRILERDNFTCRYCGGPADQAHHVDAQSRGGTDDDSNLVACCGPCNLNLGADRGGGSAS